MTQRIEWIDTAKMLTMFLVIIGHCNYYTIATPYGGIYYSEQINGDDFSLTYRCLGYLVAFIYSFHMPLFMALSGMLFSLSMKKKIILDLNEEQKQHMTVEDLLAQFEKASGRELANDRMLLA